MSDSESVRNHFDQLGRGNNRTIDDFCLHVICPSLMEKLADRIESENNFSSQT